MAVSTTNSPAATPSATSRDLHTVLVPPEWPDRPSPLAATAAFGWRAMLKIKHVPEQLFDVTAFPIMMTLMFTYLFGGAIAGGTGDYIQFLLPGIMVMSVIMTTMYTGSSVKNDIDKGVFDRFRTLPIWRPSPMVGYLLGDLFRYTAASVIIVAVGLILGFRPDGGIVGVVAGILMLLAAAFSISWIWTSVGLIARTEKSVMGISMMILFPLTFLSNVFVDPRTMPSWLQNFVDMNPITHLVTAIRSVMAGAPDYGAITWVAVFCTAAIVVFGSTTMWLYNRK
ncbi:ABC transporter permease [Lipingzhangella sp. LS1_29]|uniref:Transport permease protein n=1 Tax=Lipingzhangella rawalii TaxID=2055835 RepID=A0ABU2H171_9ACTN|nr:ABC transporter permease [Lipingzhangella rawalii]MDS1269048.1 ABC transporter permease [Lipingzhangella rawalii]